METFVFDAQAQVLLEPFPDSLVLACGVGDLGVTPRFGRHPFNVAGELAQLAFHVAALLEKLPGPLLDLLPEATCQGAEHAPLGEAVGEPGLDPLKRFPGVGRLLGQVGSSLENFEGDCEFRDVIAPPPQLRAAVLPTPVGLAELSDEPEASHTRLRGRYRTVLDQFLEVLEAVEVGQPSRNGDAACGRFQGPLQLLQILGVVTEPELRPPPDRGIEVDVSDAGAEHFRRGDVVGEHHALRVATTEVGVVEAAEPLGAGDQGPSCRADDERDAADAVLEEVAQGGAGVVGLPRRRFLRDGKGRSPREGSDGTSERELTLRPLDIGPLVS
jgi:hypothetical protein